VRKPLTALLLREDEMRKLVLLGAVAVIAIGVLTASAQGSAGPPAGTFYAFDETFKSVITPTAIPDRGPFDTLYMFPDCATCAPVSDGAPGHPGYNGGRWNVVLAYGITTQLTNAEDVVDAASSLEETGTRFVCPLIRA
jgi:hypothetical protein